MDLMKGGNMKEKKVVPSAEDYADTSCKLPVCVCLDVADGNKRRDILEAMTALMRSLEESAAADLSVVVAVSAFNCAKASGLVNCKDADVSAMYSAVVGDETPAGGLSALMELIARRVELSREMGLPCFRPILLVITDGASAGKADSPEVIKAKEELFGLSEAGKLTVVTVSYEIADGRDAEQLFGATNALIDGMSVYQPIQISSLEKMKEFFARTGEEIIRFAEGKTPQFEYAELLAWDEF